MLYWKDIYATRWQKLDNATAYIGSGDVILTISVLNLKDGRDGAMTIKWVQDPSRYSSALTSPHSIRLHVANGFGLCDATCDLHTDWAGKLISSSNGRVIV